MAKKKNKKNNKKQTNVAQGEVAADTSEADEIESSSHVDESSSHADLDEPDDIMSNLADETMTAVKEDPKASLVAEESKTVAVEDKTQEPEEEEAAPPLVEGMSEGEKRKIMIDTELMKIIKDAEDNELEDDFEPEALEALKIAANKICYLKKYYNVIKDEIIYFPSVMKTILNYDLVEEAEKYYFDEEDEFPMQYSAALRSIVAETAAEEDDDDDDDYMAKLAMDVDIGEEGGEAEASRVDDMAADEAKLAEEKRMADEEAADETKLAEEKRIADENAADEVKLAEEKRMAEEEAAQEIERAEEKRVADENAAEEVKLAEEKRMVEEEAAQEIKAAEEKRIADENAAEEVKLAEEKRMAEEEAAEQEMMRATEEKTGEEHEDFIPHESISTMEAMLENALNAELNSDPGDTLEQIEEDDTKEDQKQGAQEEEEPYKPDDSISRMEEMLERALLDDLEIDFTQEPAEEESRKPKPEKAVPKKAPAPKSRNILAKKKIPASKPVAKPITRPVTTRSNKSAPAKPRTPLRKAAADRKITPIRSAGSSSVPRVATLTTASSAAKTVATPTKVRSGSKEHHVTSSTPPRSRQRKSKPKPAKLFPNNSTSQLNFNSSMNKSLNGSARLANSTRSFQMDGQRPKPEFIRQRPGSGVLDDTFQPYLHGEKSPCELCYFLLSPDEKAVCDIRGRHLRVVMSTGGCDRSCSVFPRAPNEPPVRLCRTCFFNTHRMTYQKVAPKRRILRNY